MLRQHRVDPYILFIKTSIFKPVIDPISGPTVCKVNKIDALGIQLPDQD